MPLYKSDIKKNLGLSQFEIISYLKREGLISIEDSNNFSFKDIKLDNLYLIHYKKKTFWKYESKEYLMNLNIRKKLDIRMKTCFVEHDNLPFIKGKEYIIYIKKLTRKTMLFESILGEFLTKIIVSRKLIQQGSTYIMIMNEKHNSLEKICKNN